MKTQAPYLPCFAASDPVFSAVPKVCLLDPDGDVVRQLKAHGRARRHDGWVCYHTDLFVFDEDGLTIGVVGCAVGPRSPSWWPRSSSPPAASC